MYVSVAGRTQHVPELEVFTEYVLRWHDDVAEKAAQLDRSEPQEDVRGGRFLCQPVILI